MRDGSGRRGGPLRVVAAALAAVGALALTPPADARVLGTAPPQRGGSGLAEARDALTRELGISEEEAAQRVGRQEEQVDLAERLEREVGAEFVGAFIDDRGVLRVNVTGETAAERVRQAGAEPARVVHDRHALGAALEALNHAPGAPTGSSWAIDEPTNAIVVRLPPGASTSPAGRAFLDVAHRTGVRVVVEEVAASVEPAAFYGGEETDQQTRCTAGFIASSGSSQYVITAGHCTDTAGPYYDTDGVLIGYPVASAFPGDDAGAILITNPGPLDPRGAILSRGRVIDIIGQSTPLVGKVVCKQGKTTGTTCGRITRLNTSSRYDAGYVFGLIESRACTDKGDSGGPLWMTSESPTSAGRRAVGIVSGRTAGLPCDSPDFRSYHQPIAEVLSAWNLTLR